MHFKQERIKSFTLICVSHNEHVHFYIVKSVQNLLKYCLCCKKLNLFKSWDKTCVYFISIMATFCFYSQQHHICFIICLYSLLILSQLNICEILFKVSHEPNFFNDHKNVYHTIIFIWRKWKFEFYFLNEIFQRMMPNHSRNGAQFIFMPYKVFICKNLRTNKLWHLSCILWLD